ncbi:MAG: tryptophan--tRNA ligase [Nanoarchaeota archaeon]|nr:tryptophan--tRNA ligase [Nanoarchaeota archaeon]
MTTTVTPWDVEGTVDYDKLIKEFGVQYISNEHYNYLKELAKEKGLEEHIFLKRKLFFAQMDLGKAIQDHKDGKPVFLYTGRAPGGSMHIGHLVPFMFTKYLQDLLDCNLYIQIPDDEKFLFKKDLTLEKIEEMLLSDLDDIAAIGFNPEKTFIFRNTKFMSNMYPLYLETAKKITFSQARNTFGFENSSNIGQINYPALQIVPTFFEKGQCLIPCAIDQNPYFLLQRDFATKLGYNKNATILSKFLTALTGPNGKMSASDPSKAILLTDEPNQVKKKVNKHAFSGGRETLEEHREKGGDCSIDVAYQWLYNIFEEDEKEIQRIYEEYSSGKMLSGEIKKILIEKVNNLLEKHRTQKQEAKENNLLEKYMKTGTLAKTMWNKSF